MKRAAGQLLVIAFLFFATWFVLKKIDWISVFHVKQVSQTTEEKLGDLIWKVLSATEQEAGNG